MGTLTSAPRTIIPALDCTALRAIEIVKAVREIELIEAFKLGSWKGTLLPGLLLYVDAIRPFLGGKRLIYDHQKGATDIPELEDALPALLKVGVHAVIFFPFGGGETQERWTQAATQAGLTVLVGGHMTQKRFLWSEGGYVHDSAPELIYRRAAAQGVRNFVVPGNKPELVLKYKQIIENELRKQGCAGEEFTLYAPGFVKQGGVISETGQAAGERWHAIVGSALIDAENIEATARELVSQLRSGDTDAD